MIIEIHTPNRRFSNFIIDRIVNGPLFQGIDTSLSNQSKLEELSKKYLSADIASLAGVYGTAFLAFLSNQSGMNVNYDKTSYASTIANLFAQEIMLRAYNGVRIKSELGILVRLF